MKGSFLGFQILTGVFLHLLCIGMRKLTLDYGSWVLLNDLMGKYFSLNNIDLDFQSYVK